jgi:hypothetical protein
LSYKDKQYYPTKALFAKDSFYFYALVGLNPGLVAGRVALATTTGSHSESLIAAVALHDAW